ncbi:MAG: hypothetical protein Q9227_001763 [Pyrenula ochraceoflavens]
MNTYLAGAPFPVLLDDPQAQTTPLPTHPAVRIAPLRDPDPSRTFGVPPPIEPSAPVDKDERASKAKLSRRNHGGKGEKKQKEKPTSIQALIQPPLQENAADARNQLPPAYVNLAAVENKLPPISVIEEEPPTKRARLEVDNVIATSDHIQLPRLPTKELKTHISSFAPYYVILNGLQNPPPAPNLLPPIEAEEALSRLLRSSLTDQSKPLEESNAIKTKEALIDLIDAKQQATLEPSDEPSTQIDAVVKPAKTPGKSRKTFNKWSEGETSELLKGVAKYGVGKWALIKNDPDFTFNNRSAVDLKDRFRVVCPDSYKPVQKLANNQSSKEKDLARAKSSTDDLSSLLNPASPPSASKHDDNTHCSRAPSPAAPALSKSSPQRQSRKAKPHNISKYSTELSQLQQQTLENPSLPSSSRPASPQPPPPPSSSNPRQARRFWTPTEDSNLLSGLSKHGMQWKRITQDLSLSLSHRRPQDLRDRIRTKFPEGYKLAPSAPKAAGKPLGAKAKKREGVEEGVVGIVGDDNDNENEVLRDTARRKSEGKRKKPAHAGDGHVQTAIGNEKDKKISGEVLVTKQTEREKDKDRDKSSNLLASAQQQQQQQQQEVPGFASLMLDEGVWLDEGDYTLPPLWEGMDI